MGPKAEQKNSLIQKINQMKSAYSNYNVVRMREALRYLSGPKLKLFIKIPLLIHVNQRQFPGFVPEPPRACGIYKFQESGFCKEVLDQEDIPKAVLDDGSQNPCVLGLYHIGSLGTFTQSAQSDFDYWVIIDKKKFTPDRYASLEKKLESMGFETYHRENSHAENEN